MQNVKPEILEQVEELRAEMGRQMIGVTEVAERMGVHYSHVSRVLRGKKPASQRTVDRIEEAIEEIRRESCS